MIMWTTSLPTLASFLAVLVLLLLVVSAQTSIVPSSTEDLYIPDNCNTLVRLHDHVLLDMHLKFDNGTIYRPVSQNNQNIYGKLDNIDDKPILKAIKGMCKNSTRLLRYESANEANLEPFSSFFGHVTDPVNLVIRVDSITTPTDFQIFQIIHNKDIAKALDLLEMQVGINAVDEWGQSALMLAISSGVVPIVAGLLNARMPKIDINYAKANGKTAIFYVVESTKADDSWLLNAMLRRGADPNVKMLNEGSFGNTPLHFACLLGKYSHVELLLEYGADPDAVNEYGQRPMNLLRDLVPSVKARMKKAFEAAWQKQSNRLTKEL